MSDGNPIPCVYEGDGEFRARGAAWQARCDKRFACGEVYLLVEEEHRSIESHRHQFAFIRETWLNWPEYADLQFTNEDDLRKHALIMSGWAVEKKQAFSSNRDANNAVAMVMVLAREYVLCSVAGNVMVVKTARSQKMRGPERMTKAEFQKSKTDLMEWIEAYLDDLRKTRGVAA